MRFVSLITVVWIFFSPFASIATEDAESIAYDESPASLIDKKLEESVDIDSHVSNGESDLDDPPVDGDKNGSSSSAPASNKRLWGGGHPTQSETAPTSPQTQAESSETTHASQPPLSFVKIPKGPHSPPEGFVITTRVYIDPKDGLAHLDEESKISLPYWDCGVTGSTTSPLPVKDAAFRHSLTPTTPWTGTDGKHPLLAVALTPIIIETNSGESKSLQAGQVILLEDVLMDGHRFLPMQHHALQVLFLTLPQTHYHPGKDRVSLQAPKKRSAVHPCSVPETANRSNQLPIFTVTNVRRGLLGVIGLSLSGIMADFLGRTAPLWLAVGVGGTFFVVTCTTLIVFAGEMVLTNMEIWYEQQRLAKHSTSKPEKISKENKENAAERS